MTSSIIQKSKLEGQNRLDSEYYQSELIGFTEKYKNENNIRKLSKTIVHPAEIVREYSEEGILYLLAQGVKENQINLEQSARMPVSVKASLKQNKIERGDVLIVRSGANYGDAGVFEGHNEDVYVCADLLIIKPEKISGEYISTFLNTRLGKKLIKRAGYGAGQPHVAPDSIGDIIIPFSEKIQKEVINIIAKASVESEKAIEGFCRAEKLLLEELGVEDFEVEDDLFFTAKLSEVKSKKRMDADYFQPKYQSLISSLKYAKKLGELVVVKKGLEPGSSTYFEEGKPFIRVSNMSKEGINASDQKYISEELYYKLKSDYQPKIGEVLLTKDATPGIAYVLKEEVDGIISGGILRLKLKEKIEPEYLALCINSIIGKMQATRDAGGSIINHWRPEQVKNILIPILPKQIQENIADLVRKSHESRKKSKELLEEAKRKIEELIEKGA
ncbi:MAG: restriction endonuclease subunit S [Patescibacteria group bacterium]